MRKVVRVLGIVVGAIAVVIVLVIAGLYVNYARLRGAQFSNPVPNVTVARTPEQVARGAYMVSAYPGCAGCHSSNPSANPPVLDGGHMKDLEPLGDFNPPNLTPGGPLQSWSDGEIIRAIREGIDKDGHALAIMPSPDYHSMSDEDVQAVVAYLRSQPAVQKASGGVNPNLLGLILVSTGQASLGNQPPAGTVTAPPRGPTADYGRYLVTMTGCATCHGPALDGQNVAPGPPPGPNLRVVKGWSQDQFINTIRTGVDPSNHQLDDTKMPWRDFGKGTDDDLRAIYQYLVSLP